MKKLLLMMLGLAMYVSSSATETRTVYYAVQKSTVGDNIVKLNVNVGDNNTYVQSNMINTGLTYTSNNITYDIYSGTFEERYGGVDVMQFQLYNGGSWVSQQQPIGSYTSYEMYTNRMYVHNFGFTDFSANYTRDGLSDGKYGTICLPFSGTVSGATLYTIASQTTYGINLTEAGTSLVAGQAYIFKASSSELTVSSLTGSYTDAATGGAIVGNYSSSAAVETGKHIIYNNKLCEAGENVTIGQYRAYIDLSKVAEATSRGANFMGFDDVSTGIESIQAENCDKVMYNLQGQRVTNGQKGLVIVGGKKVLRK